MASLQVVTGYTRYTTKVSAVCLVVLSVFIIYCSDKMKLNARSTHKSTVQ